MNIHSAPIPPNIAKPYFNLSLRVWQPVFA